MESESRKGSDVNVSHPSNIHFLVVVLAVYTYVYTPMDAAHLTTKMAGIERLDTPLQRLTGVLHHCRWQASVT